MNIVCLGWGSLIWNPGGLPIIDGWKTDGPMLPVEFARQSNSRLITLVIVPGKKPVQTLWAKLSSKNISDAKIALCDRERIPQSNLGIHIGSIERGDNNSGDDIKKNIYNWMEPLGFDAVIWTALPPKFNGMTDIVPTKEQLIAYLSSLEDKTKKEAEDYIRKAPSQIDTEYRKYIESCLGWTRKV